MTAPIKWCLPALLACSGLAVLAALAGEAADQPAKKADQPAQNAEPPALNSDRPLMSADEFLFGQPTDFGGDSLPPMGDKPEPPSGTQGKPEPPSGTQGKPEPPSGTQGKPEPPSGTQGKPEPPSGTQGKPEPPSGTQGKPEPPSGVNPGARPGPPSGSGSAGRPGMPGSDSGASPDARPAQRSGPSAEAVLPNDSARLRFNFRFQPWKDVLEWFAQQAGLSLVLDTSPPGTFNYTDDRTFSPAESLDLLNSVLLTKGFALIRRERMLMVVNVQDGIPPNLVPTVSLEDLDKRGEFELVATIFDLERLGPEEAEAEIKKLLGPQGTLISLSQARQIQVTDTAGRLRNVERMLRRINDPEDGSGQVRSYTLRQAVPQQVMDVLRQLLDIPAERNASTDGSIRFAIDVPSQKLIVTGKPEKLARVEEILKTLDVPVGTADVGVNSPQLEVYPITGSDPESALKVLQTLLAGQPDVRLSLDSKAGTLIALARPGQHATIKSTLEQMDRDGRKMEVITLEKLEPSLAMAAINKLFSESGSGAPQIDADTQNRRLLVHGSGAQIAQIRTLLEKMGEGGEKPLAASSTVRMLPLSGRNVREALERVQQAWPQLHDNPIRMVNPGSTIWEVRPSQDDTPDAGATPETRSPQAGKSAAGGADSRTAPQAAPQRKAAEPAPPATPAAPSTPNTKGQPASPVPPRTAGTARQLFWLVSQSEEQAAEQPAADPPPTADPPAAAGKHRAAPIVIATGPGGVLLMSEDTQALDDLERMLTQFTSAAITGGSGWTIFYLKHTKAATVSETVERILAEGFGSSADGGLVGDSTQKSGGSGSSGSSSVQIIPDTRLNALVVHATAAEVDAIEQLLKILDRKQSPEDVAVESQPRIIPLSYTSASDMAEIVKNLYQDRMVTGSGSRFGGGGGSSSGGGGMMDMMQMFRSRRGGSRSGDDVTKMSVGSDSKTNSLVVVAPDALFQEVKVLVEQLDTAAADNASQTMRVVTLDRVSMTSVQKALTALMGSQVQVSSHGNSSSSSSGSSSSPTVTSPMMGMPGFFGGFGGGGGPSFGGGGGGGPGFGGGGGGGPGFGGGGPSGGGPSFGGGGGGGPQGGGPSGFPGGGGGSGSGRPSGGGDRGGGGPSGGGRSSRGG